MNRTLEINNNELKNSISRYISNNRKLQDTINKLKLDYTKPLLTIEQIEELNNKVKFYQEENIRLSDDSNVLYKIVGPKLKIILLN